MIRLRHLTVIVSLALTIMAAARGGAAQTTMAAGSTQGAKPPIPTQGAKPAEAADTRDVNLRAYVELLRSDVRGQKVAILTELMEFTEQEDAKFWPIYREYDVELSKLNDERITLIKEYANNYEEMTDTVADRIARGALDLEGRRNALKLKYYDRLASALSAKTAARFLQVENQLLMILDLQISAALPVVK
jgi:hypothetical protein